MVILFIHQNFPGQFRAIAEWLGKHTHHKVIGLGDECNRILNYTPDGVSVLGYATPQGAGAKTHAYVQDYERDVRRGQQVVRAVQALIDKGFKPDVVIAHTGWGEALYLKQVFPDTRLIQYCEFYYHATGKDLDFDPEFPVSLDKQLQIQSRNATQLLSLTQADCAISASAWQRSLYPPEFLNKIQVLHEGVDTNLMCPDPCAQFIWQQRTYTQQDKIVTYIARNLEPYRGFHSFMRSLPHIQKQHPDANIFIVGGDDVSYGAQLPEGERYRERYIAELGDRVDWSKVHFTGQLPYSQYRNLLQITSVHTYFTYPFVLSWSLLDAMSIGCTLVASATPPVLEVIKEGENGLLVDFFAAKGIADSICQVLSHPERFQALGEKARQTVIERYDLNTVTLPRWVKCILEQVR